LLGLKFFTPRPTAVPLVSLTVENHLGYPTDDVKSMLALLKRLAKTMLAAQKALLIAEATPVSCNCKTVQANRHTLNSSLHGELLGGVAPAPFSHGTPREKTQPTAPVTRSSQTLQPFFPLVYHGVSHELHQRYGRKVVLPGPTGTLC